MQIRLACSTARGSAFKATLSYDHHTITLKNLECNLAKEVSSQIKFAVSQRLTHFILGKTIYIQLKSDP